MEGDRSSPSNGLVLIVDDDASMRMLLKAAIERAGFASIEASDGESEDHSGIDQDGEVIGHAPKL